MKNEIIDLANYAPYFRLPENEGFSMRIGGTVYEITTHFDTEGKESVLQQFRDLILEIHRF